MTSAESTTTDQPRDFVLRLPGTNRDAYVSVVSDITGESYDSAKAKMDTLLREHGITYVSYLEDEFFSYSTNDELRNALEQWHAQRTVIAKMVTASSGWTFDRTWKRMKTVEAEWPHIAFPLFLTHRMHTLTNDEIAEKATSWDKSRYARYEHVAKAAGLSVSDAILDMLRGQALFGLQSKYYLGYKSWELTDRELEQYATKKSSRALYSTLNRRPDFVDDKLSFSRHFGDLMHRKSWTNRDTSFEDFQDFTSNLDKAFCKPADSDQGRGIYVLNLPSSTEDLFELYQSLIRNESTLLEEMITQHSSISKIYSGAVNTVRVLTVRTDQHVHIISATMRFGRTTNTDNFSINGIVCDVDLDTGELITPGIDKTGTIHYRHPVSGQEFVGFAIPMWEKVRELVVEAASIAEGVDFVGWDVAIGEEKVSLVEGNARPGTGLIQAPYAPHHFGRSYVFNPYMPSSNGHHTSAELSSTPDIFEFELTDRGARLIRYTGLDRVVHVPSYALGEPVVEIGPRAFENCSTVEQVRLPNSVQRILRFAFSNCESLVSLYLGTNLRLIGTSAFSECSSLTSIRLPQTLRVIKEAAFAGCSSLKVVEVPPNVRRLEPRTFAGCSDLVSVVLPQRMVDIQEAAFDACTSLRDISQQWTAQKPRKNGTYRNVSRNGLPSSLEQIGAQAFNNCSSLEEVSLPSEVRTIRKGTFSGCTSLKQVFLHNRVLRIGPSAFHDCQALETLRIPLACKRIAPSAFPATITLRAPRTSETAKFSAKHGFVFEATARESRNQPISLMRPSATNPSSELFYTPHQRAVAAEHFAIRPPSIQRREHRPSEKPSFTLEGGVYHRAGQTPGRLRLMLVGDIMARAAQIEAAQKGGIYDFNPPFRFVRELLQQGDLVVGNLETLLSPDFPYSHEREQIDLDRYYNAPPEFAHCLRNAGVDAVVNGNNHAYDLGVEGIFDTLQSLNHAQLAHTGLYASSADPRFIVFEIDDIRISLHSFLDPELAQDKKPHFTRQGRRALFSYPETDDIERQLADARAMNVDFSIAYCHWGARQRRTVTRSQRQIAQHLAEGGIDLILGTHPHCLQPYEKLRASDGKTVHCLWSAGNFLSDLTGTPVNLQDTLVLEVSLERAPTDGKVKSTVRYHPGTILNLGHLDYAVVPGSSTLRDLPEKNRELTRSRFRVSNLMKELLYPASSPQPRNKRVPKTIRQVDHQINLALDYLEHYSLPAYSRENFGHKRDLDPVVMSDAAERRGLDTRRIAPELHYYTSDDAALGFHMHMSSALRKLDRDATNNKFVTSAILRHAGLPTARGVLVTHRSQLRRAFREIGFPLVVKPEAGSFGRGVRLSIETEDELREAADPILSNGENVIVEEMFLGIDLRIAVVDGEARAATFRVPANVVGDGHSTIAELVEKKNSIRANNDYISHQIIKFTPGIIEFLDKTGYSLDSVPGCSRRVFLHHVANISAGGDSYEVIDELHPDLKDLAVRTAALFPSALHSGIDVLVQYLDRGLDEQRAIICEVNLNNELPLHTHPVGGKPTPLADIELPVHWEKESQRLETLQGPAPQILKTEQRSLQEVHELVAEATSQPPPADLSVERASILKLESAHFERALVPLLPEPATAHLGSDGFLYIETKDKTEVTEPSGNRVFARALARSHAVRSGFATQLGIPLFRRYEFTESTPEEVREAVGIPGTHWRLKIDAQPAHTLSSVEEMDELVHTSSPKSLVTLEEETVIGQCAVLTRGDDILSSLMVIPFGVRGTGTDTVSDLVDTALNHRLSNPQNQLRGVNLDAEDFLSASHVDLSSIPPRGQWLSLSKSHLFRDGAWSLGLGENPWAELPRYSQDIANLADNRGLMITLFGLRQTPNGLQWAWQGSRAEPRLVMFKYPHYGHSYDGFNDQASFLLDLPLLSIATSRDTLTGNNSDGLAPEEG